MVEVGYHDSVKLLQAAEWNTPGPFARPAWFARLEESGLQPVVALAREGDAMMALPLMKRDGALVPLANWYSFTWQPLATHGADPERLMTALARDLKRHAAILDLSLLPDEDDTASRVQRALRGSGWRVELLQSDTNHVLQATGLDYAHYCESLPGTLRTSLKRKAKKLAVEIQTCFDEKSWAHYEAIYAASWKPEEGDPALLRAFARDEGAAGRLRFALARHDGVPVAAQFWTVQDGTAYIHKLAYLETHRKLSAGTVLTAALMERVLDTDRVSLVDFGTGDDGYKAGWMNHARPRFRLLALNPADPRAWPAMARRAARKLASSLRRR